MYYYVSTNNYLTMSINMYKNYAFSYNYFIKLFHVCGIDYCVYVVLSVVPYSVLICDYIFNFARVVKY